VAPPLTFSEVYDVFDLVLDCHGEGVEVTSWSLGQRVSF
jgi:hypothetical protein